jgi:hypothetical protein
MLNKWEQAPKWGQEEVKKMRENDALLTSKI